MTQESLYTQTHVSAFILYIHELLAVHHFRIMESQTVVLDDDVESSKSGNVLKLVLRGLRVVLQKYNYCF